MGMWDRVKGIIGGDSTIWSKTFASATTLNVPDDIFWMDLTGTATVSALVAADFTRGRLLILYQSDTGVTTLNNSPGTTTTDQMDLGSLDNSNLVLSNTDLVCLRLRPDGSWIRVFNTNN